MGAATEEMCAIVPIAMYIRNEFGGPGGAYDVSSLDPADDWREGCEAWSEEADNSPKDKQFITIAKQSIYECIDQLVRHFIAIGAVVVPHLQDYTGDDQSPGVALIVSPGDQELASSVVHFNAALPSIGRLRNLSVEIDTSWSSSACPQTLIELFDAARHAHENIDRWAQPMPNAVGRLPLAHEEMDQWVARVCVSPERLRQIAAAWEASCQDLKLFSMHPLSIGDRDGEIIDWLIPGLIQRGEVTSLVGPGGVGKTTALAEFVAKVGDSPNHGIQFLGANINHSNGLCAYISAEDRQGVMKLRIEQYQAPGSALNAFLIDGCGKTIDECLMLLDALPALDLVVIDPVTQFVDDENEAGKVGPFYNALSAFARRKNCAVIAVHHLTKSKNSGRTGNVRNAIRGSSVHVDRPRLVFCMLPRGEGVVEIGIVKSNVPPGQPAWGETGIGKLFKQTSDGLVAAEGNASRPPVIQADTKELIDWVTSELAKHNDATKTVRRTGQKSLYRLWRGGAVPFPRTAIENCVSDFVASGRVIDDLERGLVLRSSEGE